MSRTVDAIVTSATVFLLAIIGVLVAGANPPIQGPLSDTSIQFRIDVRKAMILAVSLFCGFSFVAVRILGGSR